LAEKFANHKDGPSGVNANDRERWAMNWNTDFHGRMQEMMAEI